MASSSLLTAQTEVPQALSASRLTWRTMSQGSTSSTCAHHTAFSASRSDAVCQASSGWDEYCLALVIALTKQLESCVTQGPSRQAKRLHFGQSKRSACGAVGYLLPAEHALRLLLQVIVAVARGKAYTSQISAVKEIPACICINCRTRLGRQGHIAQLKGEPHSKHPNMLGGNESDGYSGDQQHSKYAMYVHAGCSVPLLLPSVPRSLHSERLSR